MLVYLIVVSMVVTGRVLYHIVNVSSAVATFLLGVGRAAEHLVDRLNDGVAVDAKDSEQLVGLAAAWHLGDCQAVHGEASLVHYC